MSLAWISGISTFTENTTSRYIQIIKRSRQFSWRPLCKAPRRLQRMMLKLQTYQFSVLYKKGKELYVADTLSRPPVADYPSAAKAKQEYEMFRVEIAEMDIEPNRVTSETMQRIKQETAKDPVMVALCDVVAIGSPAERKETPEHLRQYWSFRDEISVYDGVVYRSYQVIVPSSLREEILHKTHKAHQGADSSIIVDHYSDYIELDSLRGNTSANSVIRAMKRQFARHGIPEELITDNGPQFESHEYSR